MGLLDSVLVVAASGVLTFFLAYLVVVPNDTDSLGSLSSVTDSTGCAMLEQFYPQDDDHHRVKLSQGKTHYFFKGPVDGKRIVFIHGINVTAYVFPQTLQALVDQGFRVLAYDLLGMGYTDAPGVKYDSDTYTAQLKDLLDHIGWEKSVICGHSLGGGIATEFADRYPNENYVLFGGRALLSQRAKKHLQGFIAPPYNVHMYNTQLLNFKHNPGFARCYFKTVQHGPIQNRDATFKRVGKAFGDRVLCIWAKGDTTCDFKVEGARFQEYMPDANFVALEGRHTVLGEQPIECVQLISQFTEQ
ncbi:alpha/beta-hydrolase [Rhizoclosmatium globosum]|uniref:Alpha/beta-hydrolase n=1 Tax=Rhizoclosmatium globosum TaxID=329046 RepID=A0A1Y2D035_9FUNG|nr:alpha/beta-hydrolase [Rhizoclosmatium globosum]|eukprot:ORY52662.1 alpha/beta-hydrolase [Rhizoclosmatium globosum]